MNIDKALLLSLFAGYASKVAILGASPSDAAIVLVLAAAHFLYNSQIQNKAIKELTEKHEALEKYVKSQDKILEDVRAAMSGMKLAQGMRPLKSG